MIKSLDSVLKDYCIREYIAKYPGLGKWHPDYERLSAPPAERTCSTCSKTCDVGVKCWWCGNE